MSDLDALLRAVIASPDDDTPRLVFADCLDDHDEHTRAAFIRTHIELARTPTILKKGTMLYAPEGEPVIGQLVELTPTPGGAPAGVLTHDTPNPAMPRLSMAAAELFAAMPDAQKYLQSSDAVTGGWAVEFREMETWSRGFPATIRRCGSNFWRDHHAGILAAAPISRVELTDTPDVGFGPLQSLRDEQPNGDVNLIAGWDTIWGDHEERFGGMMTIPRSAIAVRGAAEAIRMRDRHEQHIAFARTPLGYLRMRWPRIEFEVARPARDDFNGFSRRMYDQIIQGLAIPPYLADQRALINFGPV